MCLRKMWKAEGGGREPDDGEGTPVPLFGSQAAAGESPELWDVFPLAPSMQNPYVCK